MIDAIVKRNPVRLASILSKHLSDAGWLIEEKTQFINLIYAEHEFSAALTDMGNSSNFEDIEKWAKTPEGKKTLKEARAQRSEAAKRRAEKK